MKKNKKTKYISSNNQYNPTISIRETLSSPVKSITLYNALNLAKERTHRGERRIAESIYTQLMEQCPGRKEPAVLLLDSFIIRGEFESSRLQVYRILALFKDNPEVIVEAVRFFQQSGDSEKAMQVLEEALNNNNIQGHHIILRAIADAYVEQGNIDKAILFYRKALDSCDHDLSILLGLAKVDSKNSRIEIRERLLALQKNQFYSPEQLPILHFALAYTFEGENNEKYFHHLKLGNKYFALDYRNEVERLHRRRGLIQKYATARFFKGFERRKSRYPAPIFIVAPPRSGTTLVEQILSAHPETQGVGESLALVAAINRVVQEKGESADILSWDQEILEPLLPRLEQYFFEHRRIPVEAQKLTIVDKGIENFDFVGLILLLWPEAHIVHIKRHPLDTILSSYHQFFVNGRDIFFNLEALAYYYVNYHLTMDYWKSLFPSSIMEIEYEAIVNNHELYTRQLLDFCRLPWDESCLHFQNNVSNILTASNLQVRQPIYTKSISRWTAFTEQLYPAIKILEKELGLSFINMDKHY